MESKNELKIKDIDFDNILFDEKSYKNILIYDKSQKTFMGVKPLRIWFDKVYGVIENYDGTRYLELFDSWIYNRIYDKINYLVGEKRNYKCSLSYDFAKIRIYSYNSLPIEKILTFNVIILIKSVVSNNNNSYYFNTFLEKGLYEDKSNTYFYI